MKLFLDATASARHKIMHIAQVNFKPLYSFMSKIIAKCSLGVIRREHDFFYDFRSFSIKLLVSTYFDM